MPTSFVCPTCRRVLATAEGANFTINGNVTITTDFPPPDPLGQWAKCTDHDAFLVAEGAGAGGSGGGGPPASAYLGGEELLPGDWLLQACAGGTYYHHFMYVGGCQFVSRQQDGVLLEPASKYAGSQATRVFRGGQAAADRARARVGEGGCYSLLSNNCEHFCSEVCGQGHHSEQVVVGTGKLLAPTVALLGNMIVRSPSVQLRSGITGGISAGRGGFSFGVGFSL